MRISFIFALSVAAFLETLQNLYGCSYYRGQQLEFCTDPFLLPLIFLSLLLIFFAFPHWD